MAESAYNVSGSSKWYLNDSETGSFDISDAQGYLDSIRENTQNPLNVGANEQSALNQLRTEWYNTTEADRAAERQRYLRRTSYQDMLADLKEAGINPYYLFNGGSGSGASGSAVAGSTSGAGSGKTSSNAMQLILSMLAFVAKALI